MAKEVTFLIYCLEEYKADKEMTGKQVMKMFDQYQVTDYILSCYEALHTTGRNYIINDIDMYIEARENEVVQ